MINHLLVKLRNRLGSIGRLVLLFLTLGLCLSLTRNIFKMHLAQKKLDSARQNLAELKHQQTLLEQELKIIKSQPFLERQARDKLGLAKEGEIILVLPEDEVLIALSPRQDHLESYQLLKPNWRLWLELFL